MKVPHQSHIVLVDGERFTLMRNTGPLFEPRLEIVEQPALEGTNFSAGARDQDPEGRRTRSSDLEEAAHGAAAAEWLNGKALAGEIEQVIVIADPKTLGEMRRHYHKELRGRIVGELAKNLANDPTNEIEKALAAA